MASKDAGKQRKRRPELIADILFTVLGCIGGFSAAFAGIGWVVNNFLGALFSSQPLPDVATLATSGVVLGGGLSALIAVHMVRKWVAAGAGNGAGGPALVVVKRPSDLPPPIEFREWLHAREQEGLK